MPLRATLLKKIAARALGMLVVVALIGFYPAYLGALHSMCGIIKGQAVRYL